MTDRLDATLVNLGKEYIKKKSQRFVKKKSSIKWDFESGEYKDVIKQADSQGVEHTKVKQGTIPKQVVQGDDDDLFGDLEES